jgi:hypothetical protein
MKLLDAFVLLTDEMKVKVKLQVELSNMSLCGGQ